MNKEIPQSFITQLTDYDQLRVQSIGLKTDVDTVLQLMNERFPMEYPIINEAINDHTFLIKTREMISLISTKKDIQGIGRKNVIFRHQLHGQTDSFNPESLENNSLLFPIETGLELELHLDSQTLEQAISLVAERPDLIDLFGTILNIGSDYAVRKYSYIPLEIEDLRPAIFPAEQKRKLVPSPLDKLDLIMGSSVMKTFANAIQSRDSNSG
jgi:hypothetical protein